jgi:hypothetical protein
VVVIFTLGSFDKNQKLWSSLVYKSLFTDWTDMTIVVPIGIDNTSLTDFCTTTGGYDEKAIDDSGSAERVWPECKHVGAGIQDSQEVAS